MPTVNRTTAPNGCDEQTDKNNKIKKKLKTHDVNGRTDV